jgi:cytochrome c
MRRRFSCITLLLAVCVLPAPARAQDADNGKTVFRQMCSPCHALAPGRTLVGPTLFGVVGRKSGSESNFQYSDANKKSGLTWDAPTLDRYLTAPREVMQGTKMVFAGLKDDQKRHDVIAYLATIH